MGRQVIQQPNGLWCEYSSISDSFVAWDVTKEQLIEYAMEEVAAKVRKQYEGVFATIESGHPAYYQFTMTYEEALENHNRVNKGNEYEIAK